MGSTLVEAKVTIRGTRPLMWHWFGPNAIPLEKEERTGVAGNDPEEWRSTVLVTKEGQLYLDGSYAFGTMRWGGQRIKNGRANIMNDISATLQIQESMILIDRWFPGFPNGHAFDIQVVPEPPRDPSEPLYLDVRGVVNPTSKARNVRYRVAASSGWQATFHMLWDKTVVNREQMKAALLDAGKFVGIGNGRRIGMGRFEVIEWDVSDSE